MNDDERRIITQYVERVAGAGPAPAAAPGSAPGAAPNGRSGPWGGSVPNTQSRPALPPVDRDADALITDLFTRYPEARYRITQTAFVQEAALIEAQNRIRRLEWEVENAQQQAQPQRGGLFGGMFGGGNARQQAPMQPPPQPVYPPGYNPQALQQGRGGSGFLGTALTTAAGVAGGMVLGNMLMNSLGGHGGGAHAAEAGGAGAGGAATGGGFGQEPVSDASPTSSAWTNPEAAAADQGWGGGADGGFKDPAGGQQDAGWGGQDDASAASYDDGGYDAGGDEEV